MSCIPTDVQSLGILYYGRITVIKILTDQLDCAHYFDYIHVIVAHEHMYTFTHVSYIPVAFYSLLLLYLYHTAL